MQQKPKEEYEWELDAENAGVEKNVSRIRKLDDAVELVREIGSRGLYAGAHIGHCLIVGQGEEHRDSNCCQ